MLGPGGGKSGGKPLISISKPQEFRQVSSIIDVDVVPETCRRVRLLKHGSDKPLGNISKLIAFRLGKVFHTKIYIDNLHTLAQFWNLSFSTTVHILRLFLRSLLFGWFHPVLFTGFYIRDGTSVRVTPAGLEKVPGIFISRLLAGGLAESTGLLAVNDEVLEVNGIEVQGKSLDQVWDYYKPSHKAQRYTMILTAM